MLLMSDFSFIYQTPAVCFCVSFTSTPGYRTEVKIAAQHDNMACDMH